MSYLKLFLNYFYHFQQVALAIIIELCEYICLYILCVNQRLCEWISTSNHMFGREIWDKLSKWIFENFQIAQVKCGQLQNFNKSRQ